jgi:hypothetical protein
MRFVEPRKNGRAGGQEETPAGKPERAMRLRRWLRSCPWLSGGFSIVVGTFVLVAWWSDRPQLTSIGRGLPPTMPNTALVAILEGVSLILLFPLAAGKRRVVAGTLCAAAAGAIVGATILEWISGLDLGIDRMLLTHEEVSPRGDGGYPGRTASEAATAFAAAAAALLTINRKIARGVRPAEIFALL